MTETATNEDAFTINIQEIKTTVLDNMPDVVKFITWSMEYKKNSITDSAGPYTTELPAPTIENFTQFSDLSKDQVISWIESTDERVPGIKAYLKQRVDQELEKALLTSKLPPWAPVVVTESATVPAEPILPSV